MITDHDLLTPKEVAERLRISGMGVYRLIRRGELRSVRIGRSLRVYRSAVKEYLKENEVRPE